ncbi:hypothetical protein UlMin_034525 [Ulmus minor]
MAMSLPSHSVLPPTRLSKPSKALAFAPPTISFRPTILGFPRSTSSMLYKAGTRRFKSHFAISSRDDGKESNPSAEILESGAGSLKTLIEIYKQAILDGDEKSVSEIEARIEVIGSNQDELVQKVSILTADIKSGKEKYIRLQADFDNFRKRTEKNRLTTRSNAQGEVIESLLAMVDNFERAKQQLKPETEKEKKIDASYQGIYKQFVEIMRSLNVAVVPTVGKPFDPLVHEAIAREESQEFKDGIIIQEFRRGFLLGDRLLRPAMVKVSSGPGIKKDPASTEQSSGKPAAAAGVDER